MFKQVFNRNSGKKEKSASKLPPIQNMPTSSISAGIGDYSMGSSGPTSDCSRTPSRSHSDRQQPTTPTNSNDKNNNNVAAISQNLTISSPPLILSNGDVIDHSHTWCETELYTEYDNGLLFKNARPFSDVMYCFVCDVGVGDPAHLTASVELTGTKSHRGDDTVPVYRQVFLCTQCRGAAGGTTISPRKVVISREAQLQYFSRSW